MSVKKHAPIEKLKNRNQTSAQFAKQPKKIAYFCPVNITYVV